MQNFTDFTPPKLHSYYENLAVKNLYQPFFDLINAQSIWTDAASRWFTQANQTAISQIDRVMNK